MLTRSRKALVRAAGIALLAASALIPLGIPITHAAPAASQSLSKSYSTSTYSLRYGDDWTPTYDGDTFTLDTNNQNALFSVTVQPGSSADPKALPDLFMQVMFEVAHKVAPPRYGTTQLHGLRAYWVSGVVRYGDDPHVGVLTVYLTAYHKHTYMVVLGVNDTASSIGSQEYQEGEQILGTISFR